MNVDPFAGITAGRLDGIDFDAKDAEVEVEHGPAYAPAKLEVQPGTLGGEGEVSGDEELAERAEEQLARINDELDASMAQALAGERFADPPDNTPDEDYTSRRAAELGLVEPTVQAPRSRRGRPPAGPPPALITYLVFGESELDDGRSFWFVASEIEATSYDNALYRSWLAVGRPAEGLKAHIMRKDAWEPRVLEIELVPRAAARKIVVRQ